MGAADIDRPPDDPVSAKRQGDVDHDNPAHLGKRSRIEQWHGSEDTESRLSDAAMLYELAYSAWVASHRHFTEAFMPPEVSADIPVGLPAMRRIDPLRPTRWVKFRPDSRASLRALELELVALDALAVALRLPDLTEKEKVTTGLLFGQIGFQVVSAVQGSAIGCSGNIINYAHIDTKRLLSDVHSELSRSLAIARQSMFLSLLKQEIEVLTIRLLLFEGKHGIARKMIKQASLDAKDHPAQIFALQFLLLDNEDVLGPAGLLTACEDALSFAKRGGFKQIYEVLLVARVRLHFHQRRWDLLPKSVEELGVACCWSEADGFAYAATTTTSDAAWQASLAMHYLLFRCLWEGRLGHPQIVRRLRKHAFSFMDDAAERRLFSTARAAGGLFEVGLQNHGSSAYLLIQSTPPNLLYALTYLVALASGRELSGKAEKAKTLIFSEGMREAERYIRADDMWDIDFSIHHGLNHTTELRRQLRCVRAEVMLEQGHAYLYRSAHPEANEVLADAIGVLRRQDGTHLASFTSHLLLLYGQFAHLLGRTEPASRYYRAGMANLVPGSELGIVLAVNAMACEGRFDIRNLQIDSPTSDIRDIITRVKASTRSDLVGMGQFLSALLDTGVAAKTKIRTAWQTTEANGDRILHVLLYAFLISVDVLGETSVAQQAETGLGKARGFGGYDRSDGVGQGSLGIWFARKLKLSRAIDPHSTAGQSLQASLKRFATRNDELMRYGLEVFGEL